MKNVWYLSVLVLKLKCKEKMWQIKIKINVEDQILKQNKRIPSVSNDT
jgi:hypothetical protein